MHRSAAPRATASGVTPPSAHGASSSSARRSDAARDAIRDGELRLTGCAFQVGDVRGTIHQLGRLIKYVLRGFHLPAGPLAAAPPTLQRRRHSTNLCTRVCWLLKGRLHWEPSTPPCSATPARRPQFPLPLRIVMTDGSAWRVAAPRSSTVAQQLASVARDCAAPMAGLSHHLRVHAEALPLRV